jgi:MFS family permease
VTHHIVDQVDDSVITDEEPTRDATRQVLTNPRFMALFLSQILTQVGGNMVLFGLTIKVSDLTNSTTSVSILLLTFLVPAVVFGAVAGVFVDRYDRRKILISTNIARGLLFLPLVWLDGQLALIYVVTAIVATLSTFFAPAESAMIPIVVPRSQLLAANGLFIFGLQASFALGFAVLGPLFNTVFGTETLIAVVALLYMLAGGILVILPKAPPEPSQLVEGNAAGQARLAIRATYDQLREGLSYIRNHHNIFWSLTYLAITASLIGVLGTLGPQFAKQVLGLTTDGFIVIVLPLGAGLVVGILVLNRIGQLFTRRRLIEGGMAVLSISLAVLALAQEVPALADNQQWLLAVAVVVAFIAGITYAFVAVPAQTALQEELPSDVRGRVFGVLNMLVSLASFVPILIVGPIADLIGTPAVVLISAGVIAATCIGSYFWGKPAAGKGISSHLEVSDPITVTATSSTLNRPIRLRYVDEPVGDETRIQYLASPVLPGVAGPAGAVIPAEVQAPHHVRRRGPRRPAEDGPDGDGDAGGTTAAG